MKKRNHVVVVVLAQTTESGRTSIDVIDPTTGLALGPVPMSTEGDVDEALASTSTALDIWRNTSASERGKLLWRVADHIRERSDVLAELLVREPGKPWNEAP